MGAAGAAALAAFLTVCGHSAAVAPRPVAAIRPVTSAACTRPAPTTPAGYRALFDTVPPDQWGGGDVAISAPLPGGRVVWLFGDTFSTGRFVHSTAIVQTGGCLHVSHRGAQLLPNDSPSRIYWVRSARWSAGALRVTARLTILTGTGPWDFRDGGAQRTFTVTIDRAGDARVVRRGPLERSPAPNPGPMYRLDGRPHHFGYGRHVHPELRLTGGRVLVTICQNWDDGRLHPLRDYAPIFTQS